MVHNQYSDLYDDEREDKNWISKGLDACMIGGLGIAVGAGIYASYNESINPYAKTIPVVQYTSLEERRGKLEIERQDLIRTNPSGYDYADRVERIDEITDRLQRLERDDNVINWYKWDESHFTLSSDNLLPWIIGGGSLFSFGLIGGYAFNVFSNASRRR